MSEELSGTYLAYAKDIAFGVTGNGTDQLAVSFQLEGGRFISAYLYFSEAAADRAIESLRHMGWKGDDLSQLTVEDLPNQVSLVIEQEEYQGKWHPKVKWINRAGGLNLQNPMDDGQKRAFAARLKARARAIPPGGSRSRSESQYSQQGGSDDIPF